MEINELERLVRSLSDETSNGSITPERLGTILLAIEEMIGADRLSTQQAFEDVKTAIREWYEGLNMVNKEQDEKISELEKSMAMLVEEDGYFWVDENMNVGAKIDNNGLHAINLIEFEVES